MRQEGDHDLLIDEEEYDQVDLSQELPGSQPIEYVYCAHCDDGGWIMYGIGRGDPHFRICEECHNPRNYLCP